MFNRESQGFKFAKYFLPAFTVLTVLSILFYIGLQQNYRQNANDPQIQMAEDSAARIQNGMDPTTAASGPTIDVAKSLSPFVVVYDQDYKVLASNGQLHNVTPALPSSVLKNLKDSGEWRQTWQPESGVRIATVIKGFNSTNGKGFVLVGRSLLEVEKRIDQLTLVTFLAWLSGSIVLFVLGLIFASGKTNFVK